MEEQQTIQQPTEKPQLDPAKVRLNKKIRRAKVRKRFFQLYVLILVLVTGAFGYHLVDVFILQHNENAGTPEFGNRLEYIQDIPQNLKDDAATFARTLPGVTSATVDNRGVVIFVDVRVESHIDLATAQEAAQQITTHFLETAGDLAYGYNIQMVVANGDPTALAEANRQASIDHIYNHFFFLAETTVAHAEDFPTQGNINRAQDNINVFNNRFNNSEQGNPHILNFRDTAASGVATLQARLDAIVPWTETEEADALEEHGGSLPNVLQGVERLVPRSNVNDFPSWGIINRETNEFQWN